MSDENYSIPALAGQDQYFQCLPWAIGVSSKQKAGMPERLALGASRWVLTTPARGEHLRTSLHV